MSYTWYINKETRDLVEAKPTRLVVEQSVVTFEIYNTAEQRVDSVIVVAESVAGKYTVRGFELQDGGFFPEWYFNEAFKRQSESRLYLADPLQALYMKKHFGVRFECRYSDDEIDQYEFGDGDYYPFEHCMLDQPDMFEELKLDYSRPFYVCKEYEEVFTRLPTDIHTPEGVILLRDGKHFFDVDIESDLA